jgi:hypothetical protein
LHLALTGPAAVTVGLPVPILVMGVAHSPTTLRPMWPAGGVGPASHR